MNSNNCSLGLFLQKAKIKNKMAENKNKQRDLESGDNPQERSKTSGKVEKKQDKQNKGERDLESGDNPEERRRGTGK